MNNMVKRDKDAKVWGILIKHFEEYGGLLDQIERGRTIFVKFGTESEECQELQDIHEALRAIGASSQFTVPKWQVSLLLNVDSRIQDMVQRMPERSLMLSILHAKLFTWFMDTWVISLQESDLTGTSENDLAKKPGDLSLENDP